MVGRGVYIGVNVGAEALLTDDPKVIEKAERLVLPGVGAFSDGMAGLKSKGLLEPLIKAAKEGTPLLGICLGMQMLLSKSEEFGNQTGLDLIKGSVERIPSKSIDGKRQTVPHIGWSRLYPAADFKETALKSFPKDAEVYFVHSYEAKPNNESDVLAWAEYGGRKICAVVRNQNIIGCQFHPEKSGEAGLTIISEFVRQV